MSVNETKVIGFFAYLTPIEIVCDGEACMIAGSAEAMRRYLEESNSGKVNRYTIRKTRFGEILQGMSLGGAYSFDEASYSRFYPLAQEEGLPATSADFSCDKADETKLMTVQLTW